MTAKKAVQVVAVAALVVAILFVVVVAVLNPALAEIADAWRRLWSWL